MKLACIFGHKYSVIQPVVIYQTEFSYAYAGYFAICERCGKSIKNPPESLPMLEPITANADSQAS